MPRHSARTEKKRQKVRTCDRLAGAARLTISLPIGVPTLLRRFKEPLVERSPRPTSSHLLPVKLLLLLGELVPVPSSLGERPPPLIQFNTRVGPRFKERHAPPFFGRRLLSSGCRCVVGVFVTTYGFIQRRRRDSPLFLRGRSVSSPLPGRDRSPKLLHHWCTDYYSRRWITRLVCR